MVRIALLGQPRVVSTDGLREFPLARKTLHVLAYVILNRERPIARDTIAFDLFPDDEEERARGSLRRNLSYLLSTLPEGGRFLDVDTERIAWRADAPAQVDVIAFETFAREGNDEAALAQYSGRLLPTIYEEWTTRERERLQDLCHEILARTVARERSERRFDAATAHAHRLLEDDPWREDMVRQLMAIRYESGDRAGALAAFDAFARRLRDEMNAAPMAETIAVRDAVLRGVRLATTEPVRRLKSADHPDVTLPLVGRDAALEDARTAWHAAADGRSGVLFVSGEAGCGKSRLATEVARLAEREGGVVVRGHTSSGGEHRPYEAFVDALRETPGLLDQHAGATFTDDRAARLQLFQSVHGRLRQLAHARPVVMLLEDLHWAGSATVDLLEFLATRLESAPVLIIATFRSDELSRTHPLHALRRQLEAGGAGVLSLERIGDDDALRAARSVLPQVEESTLQDIVRWAGGLPLLLVEALRDAAAGRPLRGADISELVGDRFNRLSSSAETALIFGAALGERFELETLAAVTGWRDSEVVDAIAESIEQSLVRASARAPGLTFAFSHDLIRRAAIDRISESDRVRVHGLIARALVGRNDADARSADIARHYSLAGEAVKAAEHWLRAARYALHLYANAEAIDAAGAGLALVVSEQSAPRRLRFALVTVREEALARTGPLEERRADARLLETLAFDEESALTAQVRIFEAFRDERVERARALASLASLADASPKAAATLAFYRARSAHIDGDYAKACVLFPQAADLYDASGDTKEAVRARLMAARASLRAGRIEEMAAMLARVEPAIETLDDLGLRYEFHLRSAQAASGSKPDADVAHVRRALEMALRLGDRFAEAGARQNLSVGLQQFGEFDECFRQTQLALEAYRDVGDATGIGEAQLNVTELYLTAGDFAGAARSIAQRSPAAENHPLIALHTNYQLAIIELHTGQPAHAEASFRGVCARAGELGYGLYDARARYQLGYVYAWSGRLGEAASELEHACATFEPLDVADELGATEALAARVAAAVHDAGARAHVSRALAVQETRPVLSFSESAWNAAAALALLGDAEAARGLAQRAIAAAVGDALRMPAAFAESYLALPWHRHALDYLCDRSVPLDFGES